MLADPSHSGHSVYRYSSLSTRVIIVYPMKIEFAGGGAGGVGGAWPSRKNGAQCPEVSLEFVVHTNWHELFISVPTWKSVTAVLANRSVRFTPVAVSEPIAELNEQSVHPLVSIETSPFDLTFRTNRLLLLGESRLIASHRPVAVSGHDGAELLLVVKTPCGPCGYCENDAVLTSAVSSKKMGLSETPSVQSSIWDELGGQSGGTAIPARSESVGKMSTNSTKDVERPGLPMPGHEMMRAVCVASSKLVTCAPNVASRQ